MEGCYVDSLDYFSNSGYSEEEIDLVSELQQIHDTSDVHRWKSDLVFCAQEHNLKVNV